jgi:hypothetical protein
MGLGPGPVKALSASITGEPVVEDITFEITSLFSF